MGMLVWIGAIVSLLGVVGLAWCVVYVMRLRRQDLEDAVMRARMQKAVLVNFAALAVSTLGLMMVIMGIVLR
ncbi:MAG: hypothetical protein JJU07_10115 [Natronohydrobacter sp.]|nr:hypothetical protein [Natronohydrobacter sp.]